ncbi:MAG: thiamine-phosphate kinase [Acidimicrobiales bacterium]
MAAPKPRPAADRTGGGEEAAVGRIAAALRRATGPAPDTELWIGDDAAVVAAPRGPLVLATDAVVEGVHADLSLVTLGDLGWKALSAAVSDIGAMGARPLHALVAICAPPATDLDALIEGVAEASAAWDCPVVGGDLSGAAQVVVSVAVTGVLEAGRPPVTRAGASAGDVLVVTGPLGGSAAGLRLLRSGRGDGPLVEAHRRPRPRLAEGRFAAEAGATAMIDVSDGLALDLHRLADASGVGFLLDAVPVAPGARLDEALGGGEDYELVVATPDPGALGAALVGAGLRPPMVIGRCTAEIGERLLGGEPLGRLGFEHAVG